MEGHKGGLGEKNWAEKYDWRLKIGYTFKMDSEKKGVLDFKEAVFFLGYRLRQ
jgi:hypothetical protein